LSRSFGYFVEQAITKMNSFQFTRSARLSLAHRIFADQRNPFRSV
jgi:hypothetical protein